MKGEYGEVLAREIRRVELRELTSKSMCVEKFTADLQR